MPESQARKKATVPWLERAFYWTVWQNCATIVAVSRGEALLLGFVNL
jgi:hypothetical protein